MHVSIKNKIRFNELIIQLKTFKIIIEFSKFTSTINKHVHIYIFYIYTYIYKLKQERTTIYIRMSFTIFI